MKQLAKVLTFLFLLFASAANVFAFTSEGHYRWRNDDGSETSATWRQNEDVGDTLNSGSSVRLRVEIYLTSGRPGTTGTLALYYSTDDSNFTQITTDSSVSDWVLVRSTNFFNGDTTTQQFSDDNQPFQAGGLMVDSSTVPYSLPSAGGSEEFEFCFKPTSNAVSGRLYYFRAQDSALGEFTRPVLPSGSQPAYDRTPTLLYRNGVGAITKAATSISATAATLNGSVFADNNSTTVSFVFGTSSGSYNDTVFAAESPVNGDSLVSVSASLTGLTTGATYYYRVTAYGGGKYVQGDEESFVAVNHPWGDALTFLSGGSAYYSNVVSTSTDPITMECWVKWGGTTGSTQAIIYNGSSSSSGLGIYLISDELSVLVGGVVEESTTSSLSVGSWTHLALVRNGGTISLYINGVAQTLSSSGDIPITPSGNFYVGGNPNGQEYFNGTIDEARFSNAARYTSNFTVPQSPFTTDANTVALYHFDEGSGSTAHDSSGNAYNLTVTNANWALSDKPLAVQAADFLAKGDVGSVTLSWRTQSEVNNAGFNILRKDPGSAVFQLIADYSSSDALKGLGTNTTGKAYQFVDNKVKSGATYSYEIQSVSTNGTTKDLTTLQATVDVPRNYALYQNYPNPFNPSTTIRFDLKQSSTVKLQIYNLLGQRVMEKDFGTVDAGRYDEVVNMDRFASGVYFYRIIAIGNSAKGGDGQKFVEVRKLVLMK
jgi:hypothetical protein